MILSYLGQKGGIGKSSLSRTTAVEVTRAGWNVLLADINTQQKTSCHWNDQRRKIHNIDPVVNTEVFLLARQALAKANDYDLLIVDGLPEANQATLEVARASDLVVLPTSSTHDDLDAQIGVAFELIDNGVSRDKIWLAGFKVDSASEKRKVTDTAKANGLNVFDEMFTYSKGYKVAFNEGYCATETRYKSLNEKAGKLIQEIIQTLQE